MASFLTSTRKRKVGAKSYIVALPLDYFHPPSFYMLISYIYTVLAKEIFSRSFRL